MPLDELASLLKGAYVVISVDTGIMHLAAAVGARLIALFGPMSPKRWGPLSKTAVVVQGGVPYLYLGGELPKIVPDNMGQISVASVLDAIDRIGIRPR